MKSKALLLLCVCSSNVYAQPKTQTAILRGQNNSHHFRLQMISGPFKRWKHKMEWRTRWIEHEGKREPQRIAYLGGKPERDERGHKNWWGTDGGFPRTEIYDFKLRVNGHDWVVPRWLYADCYEPNTVSVANDKPFWWAWMAKDGSRVTVKMHASDGAGSYHVVWHLRRNGKHTRFVTYPS